MTQRERVANNLENGNRFRALAGLSLEVGGVVIDATNEGLIWILENTPGANRKQQAARVKALDKKTS